MFLEQLARLRCFALQDDRQVIWFSEKVVFIQNIECMFLYRSYLFDYKWNIFETESWNMFDNGWRVIREEEESDDEEIELKRLNGRR